MIERSPEDVAAGILRIAVGGVVREVPTLKARWIADWAALLDDQRETKPIGDWTLGDVANLSGRTVDKLVELIVAYDRTAALGGRDWLLEHADPTQLHEALVQMMDNAFPLADEPATLADLLLAKAASPIQPHSSNGASTTGTSIQKRSGRASTRSR